MGSAIEAIRSRRDRSERTDKQSLRDRRLSNLADKNISKICKEGLGKSRMAGFFGEPFFCPHCNGKLSYQLLVQAHKNT